MSENDQDRHPFPEPFFAVWEEDGTTKSGTLKIQSDNNEEYFKDHSSDLYMPEDGKHIFKFRAFIEGYIFKEIDVVLNIEPFIEVPSGPHNEEIYYVIGASQNP